MHQLFQIKDVVLHILYFLTNRDQLNFMGVTKSLDDLKFLLFYNKQIDLQSITTCAYFNRFTNIIADKPSIYEIKARGMLLPPKTNTLVLKNFAGHLKTHTKHLKHLTHLTVLAGCKLRITKSLFPTSITHLTWKSNQIIDKCNIFHEGIICLRLNNISTHILIPNSVQILELEKNCKSTIYFRTTSSCKTIKINSENVNFKILAAGAVNLDDPTQIVCETLPATTTKVILGSKFNLHKWSSLYNNNVKTIILPKHTQYSRFIDQEICIKYL